MKCPYCQFMEDRVLDSRVVRDGEAIKRRRECLQCGRRYTTYELIEERRVMVVKKDGRREPFDRSKILRGLEVACRKRPVSAATLEEIVDEIERQLYDRGEHEANAAVIGEMVVEALRNVDPVAYVRFASVYRDFQDLTQFQELVERLRRPVDSPRNTRKGAKGLGGPRNTRKDAEGPGTAGKGQSAKGKAQPEERAKGRAPEAEPEQKAPAGKRRKPA
jgi:transcriptional repressor NrdR